MYYCIQWQANKNIFSKATNDIFKIKWSETTKQMKMSYFYKPKSITKNKQMKTVKNILRVSIPNLSNLFFSSFFFSEVAYQRNHALIPPEKHTKTQWSMTQLYFTF